MNPAPLLSIAAGFSVCAGLLYLSAELADAATPRVGVLARVVFGVGVALAAFALWWPASRLPVVTGVRASAAAMLPILSSLALAGCAAAASLAFRRARRRQALIAALVTPVAACVYVLLAAPGLSRVAGVPAWLGAAAAGVLLALALLATFGLRGSGRSRRTARLAAVGGAAVVLSLQTAFSTPSAGTTALLGELLPMLGLLGLGATLRMVLRASRQAGASGGGQAGPMGVAAVDALTGLPTRQFFETRLHEAAKRSDTNKTCLAVLFIDLDGFKPVNDTFGHTIGDRVLEQVGERLRAVARKAGVAARVGGDEFLLLAIDASSGEAVGQLAQELIDVLGRPYRLGEREVVIACSIGIAVYPQKCHPNKLIARANAAMYAAKRAGGSRHCFYSPEMDADVQVNFETLRDLRTALGSGELELFFQPKIDAVSGKITAAEALLRWNHPVRGLVMPSQFVPLAERSGLIVPLGNWVIEAACKQARAWRDKGLRMRVAINLAAHQMRQDDIADRIAEALARHRIHPSLLTCEITESAAMEDTAASQNTFQRLGELGVHLSIDDFGTGYSSLSYLRRLPAEELKIDASFVKDVDHSADARAIVDAVVKLAHALSLKVVAEGVENLRQYKVLVELGCDELQGYLFAKPMSAQALLLWALEDRSASAIFRDSLFGETRHMALSGLIESET